ncbi:general stress protein [Paenibacillus sinopodophylli]|uniref:general stress protein n=1 Tax=Paenibacillus sinopodophylli TaxID=1837342 RepID=UPI001486E801|nr:general stress protein [Paenibacillus sinopodophylli]
MARKIGVFQTEQQAIDVISQLEQAGFVQGELKVLAKDSEHSRRIESESDVHVDELRELEAASDDEGDAVFGMTAATGYAGAGANAVMGMTGYGIAPYTVGGNAFAAAVWFGHDEHGSTLHALGLDNEETQICSQALQQGSIVVIVETDETKSMLDKDGGPDLSRQGAAEAAFRSCGASLIVAGA